MFSHVIWSLPRKAFTIPYFNFDIWWYGVFWAMGFYGAYHCFCRLSPHLLKNTPSKEIRKIADNLLTYIILGVVIGARLIHFFFYESVNTYIEDPLKILNLREGGFASHGGALGTLISLGLFYRKYPYAYRAWLDLFFPCSMFLATCLRLGNAFNQEILGLPTSLPWAFIFPVPFDGSLPQPRHPVQLYESLFYFICFILLYRVYKRWASSPGLLTGCALILVFAFRFFIEFVKDDPSLFIYQINTGLNLGQWLSFPFIGLGTLILLSIRRTKKLISTKIN